MFRMNFCSDWAPVYDYKQRTSPDKEYNAQTHCLTVKPVVYVSSIQQDWTAESMLYIDLWHFSLFNRTLDWTAESMLYIDLWHFSPFNRTLD